MPARRNYLSLLFFVLIVTAVAASGATFLPGAWYAQLHKPTWTPPNLFFPVIWSILYLIIAFAGWFIFSCAIRLLKVFWLIQLLLNGLWSWLFFGLHRIGLGLIDIIILWCCIAVMLWLARASKQVALVWLMLPYLLWVFCAILLNGYIFLYNPI